jgi:hypothetical protein
LVRTALYKTVNGTLVPAPDVIDLYAVNYNILRVMSGLGGIAYAN